MARNDKKSVLGKANKRSISSANKRSHSTARLGIAGNRANLPGFR